MAHGDGELHQTVHDVRGGSTFRFELAVGRFFHYGHYGAVLLVFQSARNALGLSPVPTFRFRSETARKSMAPVKSSYWKRSILPNELPMLTRKKVLRVSYATVTAVSSTNTVSPGINSMFAAELALASLILTLI